MDEIAYARHINRAREADSIYWEIRELYGWVPWREAYFMAVTDKLLSKEQKELVKEFHPIVMR